MGSLEFSEKGSRLRRSAEECLSYGLGAMLDSDSSDFSIYYTPIRIEYGAKVPREGLVMLRPRFFRAT